MEIKGMLSRLTALLLVCVPTTIVAGGRTNIVVMLGDSTTLCSRNKSGAKLTDYIQTYLTRAQYSQVTVVNSGQGSDTAKGGFARLQEAVLAHDPDVVTISFGLNDAGLLTPDEFREWMEKIIQAVQQKSRARILLITSTPFNNARHAELSKWGKGFHAEVGLDEYMDANICMQVRKLARKYGVPICDLHRYFRDKFKNNPALIDVLLLPDGVHLTDEGNRVATEYLAPMLASLIGVPVPGKRC